VEVQRDGHSLQLRKLTRRQHDRLRERAGKFQASFRGVDLSSREARYAETRELVEQALARREWGAHTSTLHERSGVLKSRKRMKSVIGSKPARCQILPSYVSLGRMSTMNISYVERESELDVWRVLHGQRDIPAWLQR
jgi:plasmid stabilization system protein ParE